MNHYQSNTIYIVKIRRNSCGKFYIPQNQNCHRDKYFGTKQRGNRDPKEWAQSVCVRKRRSSFLKVEDNTGKIFGGILHKTQ